jgi:hypothetical protein
LGISTSWFASSSSVWLLLIHLQTKRYALQLINDTSSSSSESKGEEKAAAAAPITFGSLIALYDQALVSVSPSTSFDIWRRLLDLHISRVSAFPATSTDATATKQRMPFIASPFIAITYLPSAMSMMIKLSPQSYTM